ncbi:hypothetical protein A2Z33_00490 [Candidatus Gottesmanbacteria bacterium RBG_16_52_11]|uniref:NTP pyrophosphohydrolase MazG-like domain-containing protein n=1 Tax=Candidatus Gottesmanbacteria bacterium RBG_16_52_11 TaxID=1798374 RepID=A0A1F5YN94_9BACT|nr:MAG: hypothetical protein A2Z33_00490 [Candidatus Gottesmanbacteria bacterium RBG_16_52_11]
MADITELSSRVGTIARQLGHNRDPKVILLFLVEELGEVIRAFMKESGHKEDNARITETYREELGDVFFLLLSLAAVKDIDLEGQLERTIEKLKTRSLSDI